MKFYLTFLFTVMIFFASIGNVFASVDYNPLVLKNAEQLKKIRIRSDWIERLVYRIADVRINTYKKGDWYSNPDIEIIEFSLDVIKPGDIIVCRGSSYAIAVVVAAEKRGLLIISEVVSYGRTSVVDERFLAYGGFSFSLLMSNDPKIFRIKKSK